MTDQVANAIKVEVSTGYDAAATSIVLEAGQGAELPDPSGDNYNLVWWDSSVYPDPADDPNFEIVRVTAKAGDTLTVTRNQEGSGASTKNTGGSTYKMFMGATAKTITDLQSEIDGDIMTHTNNADAHHTESHGIDSHTGTALTVDTIDEKTAEAGVTIEGLHIENSQLKQYGDQINEDATDTDEASVAINYTGYQTGTTRHRDFKVFDGKNAELLHIDGSTQKHEFTGEIDVDTINEKTADAGVTIEGAKIENNDIEQIKTGTVSAKHILGASVTAARNSIARIVGKWTGNEVAAIWLSTGDDTTNKDDGVILFRTSSAGSNLITRMTVDNDGVINIADTLEVDTINENSAGVGVTIDTVLIKDGLVDGLDCSGIEAGADVTDAVNVASSIHGVASKATPVDADELGLIDSAAANVLKKLTWTNVKATLKTYFDTLYVSNALVDVWLPAEAAYLPVDDPAGLVEELGATVYAGHSHLTFDDTTSEHAVWRIPLADYDGGNIVVTAYSKVSATPAGAVTLQYNILTIGLANSEAFDAAVTVDTNVNISHSLNTSELLTDIMIASATIDPANVAADDLLVIELSRDVGDTLVGDGELVAIMIEYTRT